MYYIKKIYNPLPPENWLRRCPVVGIFSSAEPIVEFISIPFFFVFNTNARFAFDIVKYVKRPAAYNRTTRFLKRSRSTILLCFERLCSTDEMNINVLVWFLKLDRKLLYFCNTRVDTMYAFNLFNTFWLLQKKKKKTTSIPNSLTRISLKDKKYCYFVIRTSNNKRHYKFKYPTGNFQKHSSPALWFLKLYMMFQCRI